MMNQIRNRVWVLTEIEGDTDCADHPIFEKAAHYGLEITDVWSPQEGQRAGSQTVVLGHIDRLETRVAAREDAGRTLDLAEGGG